MRSVSAPHTRKYKNVRSSGYLTPAYRYRDPPSTMSWLEDDIDLNDIEGRNRSKSPEPQLDDFIYKVIQKKRIPITKKKENAYKSALYLAAKILEAAFDLERLYPKYIRYSVQRPDICDFRAIDKNIYVCLVPMRNPARPDSFVVPYRSPGDMPTHRMLVHVNDTLTKEERLNVVNDWIHCLDQQGFLRPDYILKWFNKGLIKASELIEVENKKTQKLAFLETSLANDGTVWVHIIGFDTENNYKINIIPCLPIIKLPKQLCLIAPIPSRRPHHENHGKFIKEVHEAIKSGEEILFLEARLEKWSRKLRCSPTLELSWGVHMGQIEDRAFAFLNSLIPRVFEDLIILINAIKEEHTFCLHVVTNKVINHAVFYQFRRSLGKLTRTQDWLLAVLDSIQVQIGLNVFPNFFLNKQNIFMETDTETLKFNKQELQHLIQCLKRDPQSICSYTGCEDVLRKDGDENDKSEGTSDSDEETTEKSGVRFVDD